MYTTATHRTGPFTGMSIVNAGPIGQAISSGVNRFDLMLTVGVFYVVSRMAINTQKITPSIDSRFSLPVSNTSSLYPASSRRMRMNCHPRFESREAPAYGSRELKVFRRKQRRLEQKNRSLLRRSAKLARC